ncbi:hypothetical protein THAOC_14115 [Thalassiosira oceanica]|uniref:Uncharacterized protein n=1 Tax=Thalassiosira oceanica TaxID=159749 RepID=K0SG19_THAOC|nr:hypothetical protein THAOC_14115 [Thalassiosira oceanica]|eukprot:EJK65078.1 hypothetical protein THAOC_14115 [Thalassiosira oceanica]
MNNFLDRYNSSLKYLLATQSAIPAETCFGIGRLREGGSTRIPGRAERIHSESPSAKGAPLDHFVKLSCELMGMRNGVTRQLRQQQNTCLVPYILGDAVKQNLPCCQEGVTLVNFTN